MAHHQNVPLGFRFRPTDQEIVGSFLHTLLVERKPLMPPYSNFIRACDLFGNKLEPSEIWNKYGGPQLVDQDLYFLSGLKKLTPKRMDRSVGQGGTWSETESFKLVEDDNENPNPIGRKRKFRYENKGSEEHTRWLLDEYGLFVGPKNDYNDRSYDFDFVICRMRKNDRALSKEINLKRSSQDQVQKKRSTNKKMKKDHQMGSPAESSSHVEQGCSSSLTGGELV
ncbi:protein SOMBRERO-like, partial [Prunus avium]|uniref:Protein SOMBRERO-like n=1 Tax=Prunus avium TaxID=42229 RepID=A0A6P5RFI4_PRUAV